MKGLRLARPLGGQTLLIRSEIVSVIIYTTYIMGMQLLTDVRKTNGQNL